MPVAFEQARDDVKVVLLRQRAEIVRRRAGNRLGRVLVSFAQPIVGQRFGQHDEIGALPHGFRDEWFEQAAVAHGCPLTNRVALRTEVHGGQPHIARLRRFGFAE